jgi:hypothetical protein
MICTRANEQPEPRVFGLLCRAFHAVFRPEIFDLVVVSGPFCAFFSDGGGFARNCDGLAKRKGVILATCQPTGIAVGM